MTDNLLDLTPFMKEFFEGEDLFDDVKNLERLSDALNDTSAKNPSARGLAQILAKFQTEANTKIAAPKQNPFAKPGLRVLHLGIPFSINSGVVTVVKNITLAFQKNGANSAIINHWWHRYSYYDKKTNSYKNVRLSPFTLLTGDGQAYEFRWALKHVLKDLSAKLHYIPQVCHVHTHTFYHDQAIDQIKKYFPRVPIVYTMHAFIPYIRLPKKKREKLLFGEMTAEEVKHIRAHSYHKREKGQDLMIKLADRVIAISQVHKEAFDYLYPEFKDKCVCIPNGTDFEMYTDLKEVSSEYNKIQKTISPRGERILVYVGRVEAQKGSKKLAEGFNLVAAKYADAKLVLVGSDETGVQKLLDIGLKQEFASRIHCTGWIKEKHKLAAYYKLADVMVQPVVSKNLYAMVALEAMMLKVPVISCPGYLSFGTTKTPQDILTAVTAVFTDKEAVKRHVEKSRQRVILDYSLEAVYGNHLALYMSLIKKIRK